VFPSYREGFPNTVLEAGAMGLPSIVTDINGCNEIITDKENGLIIPSHDTDALYDAMKYFAENKAAIKAMGKKAHDVVASKFEQKMIWGELLKVYESLST
jgi:glycosyltransferase involved in cell wall biosynthesis